MTIDGMAIHAVSVKTRLIPSAVISCDHLNDIGFRQRRFLFWKKLSSLHQALVFLSNILWILFVYKFRFDKLSRPYDFVVEQTIPLGSAVYYTNYSFIVSVRCYNCEQIRPVTLAHLHRTLLSPVPSHLSIV